MTFGSWCAFALAVAGASSLSSPDEVLRAALSERYPQVVRWDLKPIAENPDTHTASAQPVSIVQLGPRSAVRVGKRLRWYAVAGFQFVVTANRRMAGGERLTEQDGILTEKNVIGAGCELLTEIRSLKDQRARKPLREGAPICSDALERLKTIARGDEVRVRYESDRIVLVTKGIAQADADLGESLVVMNPESRRSFRALVSGDKEVTVHD